jgi:hypothetical protein
LLVIAPTILVVFVALIVLLSPHGAGAATGPFARGIGSFHVDCGFSHRAKDDPIVYPRGPGQAHSHDFVGNETTDAYSSIASLKSGATNCVRTNTSAKDADRSAYWFPTLYVADRAIKPTSVGIYYATGTRQAESIEAFPSGLRMISGDAKGVQPVERNGQSVFTLGCPGGTLEPGSATRAPTCRTRRLDAILRFPDCWDGQHLDSRDHTSHMAFSKPARVASNQRVCPSTHPRLMPMLQLSIRYPTTGGPTTRVASGAINTIHADFMNGWNQAKLKALVRDCLARDKYCGGGDKPVPGHQGT